MRIEFQPKKLLLYIKMKTNILIILFYLLSISDSSIAQNSFSRFYDNSVYGNRISDQGQDFLALKDSGYLFSTFSINLFESDTLGFALSYLQIIRINNIGDTIFHKIYQKKKHSISVKYISPINDSTFLLAGYIFDLVKYKADSTGAEILLVKINSNGDTIWTKTLGIGDGDELVSRIINTSDGGFAIFGQTCDKNETNCDYFLMKVDSNGNKLWHNTYSLNASSWEMPETTIETMDHGFLLAGYTLVNSEGFLVKTDSLGIKVWTKQYKPFTNFASRAITDVCIESNNTYLITGVVSLGSENRISFITRINHLGEIINEYRIGIPGNYTSSVNVHTANNKIFIQGETNEYLKIGETGYHTYIYAFEADGKPLWRRTYPDSLVKNKRYLIYDMKPSLDNGFAMIGFGMDPQATNPQNNQDVWFLKVDSNGCLYQPCVDMTVGIADDKEIISKVLLFPNPCKDVLNITLDEEIEEVSVYNSIGQLLLQENMIINNQVNIEQIPNGFLFVKIKTKDGNVYAEKVWKE